MAPYTKPGEHTFQDMKGYEAIDPDLLSMLPCAKFGSRYLDVGVTTSSLRQWAGPPTHTSPYIRGTKPCDT